MNNDDILTFTRFPLDSDAQMLDTHMRAAVDKLHTLFPGKKILIYDSLTIGVETDSFYSLTGMDTYTLGLLDGETPALYNTRDESIITFRV